MRLKMREILFRGKRKDNAEWVYGNFVRGCVNDFAYIVEFGNKELCRNYVEVIPSTIGQYIGLTDKNGKRISEGDIVKGKDNLERNLAVGGYIDHENGSFVIVGEFMTHYRWLDYELEVIGNRYDDPELLEGGVDNG